MKLSTDQGITYYYLLSLFKIKKKKSKKKMTRIPNPKTVQASACQILKYVAQSWRGCLSKRDTGRGDSENIFSCTLHDGTQLSVSRGLSTESYQQLWMSALAMNSSNENSFKKIQWSFKYLLLKANAVFQKGERNNQAFFLQSPDR